MSVTGAARRRLRLVRRGPAWLRWLTGQVRSVELLFIGVAILVGIAAGALTVGVGVVAHAAQHLLFRLPPGIRLSGMAPFQPWQLAVLPVGGAILVLFNRLTRAGRRKLVDVVEANALHGGRLSVADSAVVSAQTVLSNGFGASVGLEAAYAQAGGAVASVAGRWLNLRRIDVRTLVGAGAGAAVAAAFGAPLAGAFYAFEIAIGAYTPSAVAPVVAAALAGAQTAQRLGSVPYLVEVPRGPPIHTLNYVVFGGLGVLCALLGIVIMRSVGRLEAASRARLPGWSRPVVGGVLLAALAGVSPQVLSAGHGALHLDLVAGAPLAFLAAVLVAKSLASIVSLGFGFRGGLFFASLFLGTLAGHLYAAALDAIVGFPFLSPANAAMVGMAALAVGVVGGPFTMTMLVLEATGNFSLTGAVLAASLVASTIVRQLFGYSFSTWRLHLRGETIRSARDVGWVKMLTAGKMMRRQSAIAPATTSVGEFRRRFPLGSTSRVVLVDAAERYIGIVSPAAVFADGVDVDAPVEPLAHAVDAVLRPEMDVSEVMRAFDKAQSDELAVVDEGEHVLGLVTDSFVRRRYADELEKAQRELFGEG